MRHTPRLLLVTEHWDRKEAGGVATSVRRVAIHLARLGIPVTVFSFNLSVPCTRPTTYQDGDLEVVHFGDTQPSPSGRPIQVGPNVARRQVFDAMEVEAARRPAAGILSFFIAQAGWLATYLSQSCGIPHVLGVRGSDVCTHIFEPRRLPTLSLAVERAAAIVCVSHFVRKRLLLAFPGVAGRTTVIQNGTDVGTAAKSREETKTGLSSQTGWNPAAPRAVFLGIPSEKKGIIDLLDAMLALPADHSLKLLSVGPEPDPQESGVPEEPWRELKQQGRLHCTGTRPRDEALQLAASGDIIVMPSLQDGLPNGLLEGMALGLCPVVSDLFADIITHQQNGLLVPRNNSAALTAALDQAARDPQLRMNLGNAAREIAVSRFSPQREAAEYVECFRRIGVDLSPR